MLIKKHPIEVLLFFVILMFNLLNHFFGVVFDFFNALFDLFDFVGHGEAVDGDGEEDADEDVEDTEEDVVNGGCEGNGQGDHQEGGHAADDADALVEFVVDDDAEHDEDGDEYDGDPVGVVGVFAE